MSYANIGIRRPKPPKPPKEIYIEKRVEVPVVQIRIEKKTRNGPPVCEIGQRLEPHGEELLRWAKEIIQSTTASYAVEIMERAIYKLSMKNREIERNAKQDHFDDCTAVRCLRHVYADYMEALIREQERITVANERERHKKQEPRPKQYLPSDFIELDDRIAIGKDIGSLQEV